MRRLLRLLPLFLLLLVAACATPRPNSRDGLDQAQELWMAAIRWGNFEGAVNLIDPAERTKHTPTTLQLERYRQVQISSYRDTGASTDFEAGKAVRDVEIGVINRHTQAERTVRYREVWRQDPATRQWWITSGLPDLWDGR